MIGSYFLLTLDVYRYDTSGDYGPDGYFVSSNSDPLKFQIMASVQPMSGEDLLILPEGERTSTYLKIYTETPLQTASADGSPKGSDSNLTKADVVVYNGKKYEVHGVEIYDRIRPHYKCMLRSLYQPENC